MRKIKEFVENLRQYVEKQPSVDYGDANSIMEALYWMYMENNNLENETVKEYFAKLREQVGMPSEEYDEVFYIVSSLCLEHGKLAFQGGFSLAMALMQEVNET